MFPKYFHTDPGAVYSDEFCYIIAKNGIFSCFNKEFFRAVIPISDPPEEFVVLRDAAENLVDAEMTATWTWQIPTEIFVEAINILRDIHETYLAPGSVGVYYNEADDCFELIIPEQAASDSSVTKRIFKPIDDMHFVGELISGNQGDGQHFKENGFIADLRFVDNAEDAEEGATLIYSRTERTEKISYGTAWIWINYERFEVPLGEIFEGTDQYKRTARREEVTWGDFGDVLKNETRRLQGRNWIFRLLKWTPRWLHFAAFPLIKWVEMRAIRRQPKSMVEYPGFAVPTQTASADWHEQYYYGGQGGLMMFGGGRPIVMRSGNRPADVAIRPPSIAESSDELDRLHEVVEAMFEEHEDDRQFVRKSPQWSRYMELTGNMRERHYFPPVHSIRRMAELAGLMPIRGAIIGDQQITDLNVVPPAGAEVLLLR